MTEEKSKGAAPKERDMDTLLNLPYSEMTDEEIERVVDYKVNIKMRDADYQVLLKKRDETAKQVIAIHQKMLEDTEAALQARQDSAIARFLKASQAGEDDDKA